MQINSPAREFFFSKKRGIGREGITNASKKNGADLAGV